MSIPYSIHVPHLSKTAFAQDLEKVKVIQTHLLQVIVDRHDHWHGRLGGGGWYRWSLGRSLC